jgi:Ca2+-binding EF-hand superfamily protein
LAKRFDKDGDGKLNEKELKEAYKAIKNNIEDQYVWNLEKQGPANTNRVLQKVIIYNNILF